MRWGAAVLGCAVLWVTITAQAAKSITYTGSDPIDIEDLSAFADGFITSRMTTLNVAGVVVSVVQGGRQILARGYGFDRLEPLREAAEQHSLVRVGSLSKTVTWTAVMQLVERGLLDLEAPVQRYLPQLQLDLRFEQPVTMKHLMAHTAGFEDSALGHLFERDPSKVLPLRDYLARYQPSQIYAPGTVPAYSNFGAALAGLVVANVSGVPFEDYVEQHILQPLGMTRSTFREPWGGQRPDPMPSLLRGKLSEGYSFREGRFFAEPFTFAAGAGPALALSTTATDMARWMLAHLGDGRLDDTVILESDTARLMHSRHYSLDEALNGNAHGFFESIVYGYRAIGHGGGMPHFAADLRLIPELDLGIFIAANSAGSERLIQEFAQMLVARYFPLPLDADPEFQDYEDLGDLEDYAGTYLSTRRAATTLERAVQQIMARVIVTSDGQLRLVSPLLTTRLLPIGSDLFIGDTPDDVFRFRRNQEGQIDALQLPFPTEIMQKVPFRENPVFLSRLLLACMALLATLPAGALLRLREPPAASAMEAWSARLAMTVALLWLLFYLLFSLGLGRLQAYPGALSFEFPNPFIVSSQWVALAAALLTALLILSVPPFLFTAASRWRRVQHAAVAVVASINAIILWQLNAIGFRYVL